MAAGRYRYVIVGAGAAGCVLADRLSADPACRVALLEAGGPDRKREIRIPLAASRLFQTAYDWNYRTSKQPQLSDRELYWPRRPPVPTSQLVCCHRMAQCGLRPRRRGPQVPWYLLINGTPPKWRLHNTLDVADLEKSLTRVMENGATTYTLASRNEGKTFQSLTINGKDLVTYGITEEDDPDPATTRSGFKAAGF
jgi:GMC oxidoreductase